MRTDDPRDIQASLTAVLADALAVFGGFLLATWIRFRSGWFAVPLGTPSDVYAIYACGAAVAVPVFLLINRSLGLYVRPQTGTLSDKTPRLVRSVGLGVLVATALAFIVKNVYFSFSSGVILLSFFTILALLLLERWVLFEAEISMAKAAPPTNRLLIVGTGPSAARVSQWVAAEPRLRSAIAGFLRCEGETGDPGVPSGSVIGDVGDLEAILSRDPRVHRVILTESRLSPERTVEIMILCERYLVRFQFVPDLVRMLTGNVEVQMLGDVPLIGVGPWPLDRFWNRVVKRAEDVAGALAGLVLSAPVVLAAAVAIRRTSPGPVWYRQERCGRNGRVFIIHKLRTMAPDAEAATGPVWAREDDPRRTRVGAFLRRHNIDELPQFWNVLKGDMSLVGPRPERPHFVEQFREDVNRYMVRHMSRPGMTGWAQVNGLRGNTSIAERVRYDLYYLENWSLAFDFKILARTLWARSNAY